MPPAIATNTSRPRRLWAAFWRIALFFVVWGTLMAPFLVCALDQIKAWEAAHSLWAKVYPDATILGVLVLATWLMQRFVDRGDLRAVGLGLSHLPKNFLAGLAIGTLWLGGSLALAWLAGWVAPHAVTGFSWHVLAGTGFSLLLNVITQQLLLNGYIRHTVQARFGFRAALVVSGVLFSAYHAGGFHGAWLPAVNVLVAAIFFGLAHRLGGNLWLPVGIHFAWNFLLGPALGLTVSGKTDLGNSWQVLTITGPALFTGGSFGFEGGLIVTLTTVLGAGLLAVRWRAQGRDRGMETPA